MKKIFSLFTLLALFSFAQAQKGKITGSVIDGSQKTVESATISLLKAKDSSVVKFSAASKVGIYTFDGVAYGNYLVSVTAVGHQKGFSPVFEVSGVMETIQLKPVELILQEKSMTGITVTARRPLIEQKIDRTVVNVEASVTNVGSTAIEVLEK